MLKYKIIHSLVTNTNTLAPLAALVKWRRHCGASNLPLAVTHRCTAQAMHEINNPNAISACTLPCCMKLRCEIVREYVKTAPNTTLKSTVSSHTSPANHLPSPLTALYPIFSHSTLFYSYSLPMGSIFHLPCTDFVPLARTRTPPC